MPTARKSSQTPDRRVAVRGKNTSSHRHMQRQLDEAGRRQGAGRARESTKGGREVLADEMLDFRRARLQDGAVEQPVHRLPPAIRVLQSAAAGEPAQHA